MSTVKVGPGLVTRNLILHYDAANPKSYEGNPEFLDLTKNRYNGDLSNNVELSTAEMGSLFSQKSIKTFLETKGIQMGDKGTISLFLDMSSGLSQITNWVGGREIGLGGLTNQGFNNITITWDATGVDFEREIWLNGNSILIDSTPNTFSFSEINLRIDSERFKKISTILLYDDVLNSGEIFQNYLNIKKRYERDFQPYTILVKTDNAGTSASNQFTIPTTGSGYNYRVEWGDGNVNVGVTGSITHTYATAGVYQIKIYGQFPTIFFNNGGDRLKLLEIQQWGDIVWQATQTNAYFGCANMNVTATDVPNLSNVTTINQFFRGCTNLVGNSSIGNWNTSNIQLMNGVFRETNLFNIQLNWNTQNVADFQDMFNAAIGYNQPTNFNTQNATLLFSMFNGAISFNQPLNFNTQNVDNMGAMFLNATSFNQFFDFVIKPSYVFTLTNLFRNTAMSTANYTDTIVNLANRVFANGGLPINRPMLNQLGRTFQNSRSGGANFVDAGAARAYLVTTLGWTIGGDTVIP
jgi:hypothetical protein